MPSNKRPTVAAAAAPSPPPKAIAKYINRDGSKVIAVPKMAPSDAAQSSPNSPQAAPTTQPSTAGVNPAPTANRKKQKKREKAAAKKAALAQEIAAKSSPATPDTISASAPDPPCHTNGDIYDQGESSYAAQSKSTRPRVNGTSQASSPYPDAEPPPAPKSKKNKKKKRGNAAANDQASSEYSYGQTRPDVPARTNNGRIWDNSTTEERDRIKQFWLGLHENERRSLVQIEKAAVLKKMKEQQKQSCSCTVCGRKRTAIEEELEGLYDAYYRELELYAAQPAGRFGPISGLPHPNSTSGIHRPSRRPGAATEVDGEDPEEEDDLGVYSDEADDGHSYSDEDPGDDDHSDRYSFATNFLNFGNNLTVQGGILTVADDLLQNDGRKFIEMMEQLAERRMQREMHGHYHNDHHHYHHHHHHSQGHMGSGVFHQPLEEGDDYEDEEDPNEDYEGEVDDDIAYSQDDDYDDDEESEDPMTEKERMEEGRRMFQIFAARMFEQRVLKAYRESVSKERSAQLLRELEEEEERKVQAKEAKAQAAQRRKEKEKERKRKQAEEKQRKEAQKKAEQEALRAEKERQAQEQKAKVEEKRRQKDLKKKADEEERLRKEAERQRRLHEQKEREERKARETREARERDRKRKEAQEAQEKAQRDKEARERREQHAQAEKERRVKAAAVAAAKEKALKENRKPKNDKHAPTASAPGSNTPVAIPLGPKRPRQNHTPIATPLQSRAAPAKFASPAVSVALPSVPNPALAKLNVPTRPRVASHSEEGAQALRNLPNHSESPNSATPAQPSPGQTGIPPGPHSGGSGQSAGTPGLPLSPLQAMGTLSAQSFTFAGPLASGMHLPPGLQQAMPPPPPGLMQPPGFPPIPAVLRPAPPPGLSTAPMPGTLPMMPPPGLASPTRSLLPPPGFGGPMDPPPGLGHASGPPPEGSPSSHSRHLSSGFDQSPSPHAQQIGRPAPIGRPGSTVAFQRAPGQRGSMSLTTELDETNTHLGSSALLDDDEPLQQEDLPRMATVAPGPGSGLRTPFPSGDPFTSSVFPPGGTWHPPVPSGTFGTAGLGSGGWPAPSSATFGGLAHPLRAPQPRQVTIRQLLCGVCRQLQTTSATSDGFLPLSAVVGEVDGVSGIEPVTMEELEVLFSTEGNRINGGGVFDTKENETGKKLVRFTEDDGPSVPGIVGAPGGIGSPVAPSATPSRSQHAR